MPTSITCPVCSNLCSSQAVACPKCGHPFSGNQTVIIPVQEKSRFSPLTIVMIVIGGLVLLPVIGLFLFIALFWILGKV